MQATRRGGLLNFRVGSGLPAVRLLIVVGVLVTIGLLAQQRIECRDREDAGKVVEQLLAIGLGHSRLRCPRAPAPRLDRAA